MKNARTRNASGGWIFLLIMLSVYVVIAAVDTGMAVRALKFSAKVMHDIWPVLIIVFFLLLAADLFLRPEWINRNLGRESGIRGWLMAAFGGVLAAGPVYAWYALLGELRDKGMRTSLAAVFLYSRAIKIPLLPLLIHYFGITYTLVLYSCLLGFSIVNGILLLSLEDRETV
jgi:uncharacterized membrane protein YraQ (UPF0718 family)